MNRGGKKTFPVTEGSIIHQFFKKQMKEAAMFLLPEGTTVGIRLVWETLRWSMVWTIPWGIQFLKILTL